MRGWIAGTALVTLGVALSSGGVPWLHALGGAFKPPDFAIDIAAARVFAAGLDPYEVNIGAVHASVLSIPVEQGYPYLPHPPFAVALIRPLAWLPFRVTAHLWFGVSLALLVVLALLLAEIATGRNAGGDGGKPTGGTLAVAFGLLLMWPPVLYNLEKGQFSILLAVLVALCWRSLVRGHSRAAGAYIGAAAAVKVFPVLLGGYLLLRAPRAVLWLGLVAATATFLPLIWMGPLALPGYIRHSVGNVAYWETWPAVTYSIHGAVARTFIGGRWAEPLVHAPVLGRALVGLTSLALVCVAIFVSLRRHRSDEREGTRFAAWATLLVLLNPLAMGHNGVLLALPILLAARALRNDERTWPKMVLALSVLLVSIPRQTLLSLAPDPVDPWRGLAVLALPLWGTLLLFVVAAAAGRPPLGVVVQAGPSRTASL